ncbi:SDR family oxidoreductase [Lichenicola cladoniae]|uniref:SDR family oxidoreductase n=1 Tax=Lichenicola cladoniae TaxID=1484109 RepID=A0A6M8HPK7_9PROT|nr:SDR family oxidoreductase [Lichenicola cladoniae]NPD66570.1 SDR family oxidoreductase [Acetobacteraceae bacterium]QKE90220.1 SDR family oxidoreductase [Lichenicola cladoniae]
MANMTNKVALVIGGASGIGLAIASRLASEGALVSLTGRRQADLDVAAATIGHGARPIVADAADPADIERAIAAVVTEHGRIDALVLNAAIAEPEALLSSTAQLFDRHFVLNVRGPLLAMRAAVPHMRAGSAVVVVGSTASELGNPPYGTYAATKAALRSYVRTWTLELAPLGIRVNVLSPGPTETPMLADVSDDIRAIILARVPLGRLARPEEIAAAALFLISDESSYMAGSDLQVDGGMGQV